MKKIFLLFFLLFTALSSGQNFEDQWTGFFSYVSVVDITQGNDRIYAASENAVFTYDLTTQEINTISTINGLAGEEISAIYYSENFGLLLIGYNNGLIEIVIDGEEDVLSVVDILDKPTIPPNRKRINHFNEYNGLVYIASEFGISEYDLAALEFGDTFFIGDFGSQINIFQTTVQEPYIYAATTSNGVRRAMVASENLIDFNEWEQRGGGTWIGIQALNDEIYGMRNDNLVFQFIENSGFINIDNIGNAVEAFKVVEDVLTITTNRSTEAYGPGYNLLAQVNSIPGLVYELQSGISVNNRFYLGTTEIGMLEIPFGSNTAQQILPDGPLRNRPFAVDASPGEVWVNFGEITETFNPFPLSEFGISNLREGIWTNLQFEEIFNANDLVNISINPDDPNEVYMSSFQKGLLKIVDLVPNVLFNETNSPLELGDGNPDVGVRLFGSDFDREGNLWFVQSQVDEGLVRLSAGGQFSQIDLNNIINAEDVLALSELAVSRQGSVFFGAIGTGLVGYNPNAGLFNLIAENIGSGNLPSLSIQALEFDNNNRLWIGTEKGLRVLFNIGGFFDEGADTDAQEIVFLENGVPQELLFGQSITDIETDGSNNKWISTATSGVFYVSSNGQETIRAFNKDNSPLPSNNVQDMAIDDFSGRVYFATINGLVAFDGTATAPRDNLDNVYAYPNPVRPGFSGDVTIDGLTADANVKITDIEGNLVFETTSEGGSVLWDTTAFGKYRVASGVYLVLVTTEDALETTVSKIMIVR